MIYVLKFCKLFLELRVFPSQTVSLPPDHHQATSYHPRTTPSHP